MTDLNHFIAEKMGWRIGHPDYTDSWEAMGDLLEWAKKKPWAIDITTDPLMGGWDVTISTKDGALSCCKDQQLPAAVAKAVARALRWNDD